VICTLYNFSHCYLSLTILGGTTYIRFVLKDIYDYFLLVSSSQRPQVEFDGIIAWGGEGETIRRR